MKAWITDLSTTSFRIVVSIALAVIDSQALLVAMFCGWEPKTTQLRVLLGIGGGILTMMGFDVWQFWAAAKNGITPPAAPKRDRHPAVDARHLHAIIRRAQRDIPILENPIGSNRSPEIDAMCKRFGVPLASYWCALWTSDVWKDAGAEIPPVTMSKAWHPAMAETWHQWAFDTGRFVAKPQLGYATLYGTQRPQARASHRLLRRVDDADPDGPRGQYQRGRFSREGELTGLKRVDTVV
jgi:hypothetical protein